MKRKISRSLSLSGLAVNTRVLLGHSTQTDLRNSLGQALFSFCVLLGMALFTSTAPAATLHVPAEYPTIQAGIDAAQSGEVVLVAPGTYTDFQTRGTFTSCAFLKDGVVVQSESGPTVTVIDVSEMSGPQRIGIMARLLSSDLTTLEGFTVQGAGLGPLGCYIFYCGNVTVRDCVFQNFNGGPTAGGAVVANGDASFLDCEFKDCTANLGGAMWASSGHLDLINCLITNCHNTPIYVQETGGATASATVKNCQFIDNTSTGAAGGMVIGVALGGSFISGCLFKGNVNSGAGAGGLALGQGSKTVEDCVFIENGAMGANGQGGGLSIGGNPLSLVRNCTFLGNYKPLNGADGGAVQFISVGYFENNVVVGSHGGGAIDDFGGVETSCNVFWDNAQGIGVPLSPTDRVVDPLFCNPAAYDLTLDSTSPCLPPYSLGCGLIGALGIGCGTTAAPEIPTRTWGQIKGLYR